MLLFLPLDIKINIAIHNAYLWSLYYIHDIEFKTYSHTLDGKIKYRRAFTVKNITILKNHSYTFRNLYHHEDDYPALVYNYGTKRYYYLGSIHRINGPAIIDLDYEAWVYNDKYHRIGGPARTWSDDGSQEYYEYGTLHRIDGPAIIRGNGFMAWYENGILIKTT